MNSRSTSTTAGSWTCANDTGWYRWRRANGWSRPDSRLPCDGIDDPSSLSSVSFVSFVSFVSLDPELAAYGSHDSIRRHRCVNGHCIVVGLLQGRELAGNEGRSGKMADARGGARNGDALRDLEINEPHAPTVAAQHRPVSFFQRRAGDHQVLAPINRPRDYGVEHLQPRFAIGLSQRHAGVHLFLVGGGMQLVALHESPAEHRRDSCADGRLPGAADAHHHDDHARSIMRSGDDGSDRANREHTAAEKRRKWAVLR